MTITTHPHRTAELLVQGFPVSPTVWILHLQGPVDASTVRLLDSMIDQVFERGIFQMVIDLAGVDYLSSSGFGCLLSAHHRATENGGRVVLSSLSPEARDILTTLGLGKILTWAPSLASALRHFSKSVGLKSTGEGHRPR
ncbi:MAG TPA: STAS domain-containing protein [Planctomycetota bacterium]|nr:STAS domain-containing protein [Planctomycetota bacterium]